MVTFGDYLVNKHGFPWYRQKLKELSKEPFLTLEDHLPASHTEYLSSQKDLKVRELLENSFCDTVLKIIDGLFSQVEDVEEHMKTCPIADRADCERRIKVFVGIVNDPIQVMYYGYSRHVTDEIRTFVAKHEIEIEKTES